MYLSKCSDSRDGGSPILSHFICCNYFEVVRKLLRLLLPVGMCRVTFHRYLRGELQTGVLLLICYISLCVNNDTSTGQLCRNMLNTGLVPLKNYLQTTKQFVSESIVTLLTFPCKSCALLECFKTPAKSLLQCKSEL